MVETQTNEDKNAEEVIRRTRFHGMLDAVAQETGVTPAAITENLEVRVHARVQRVYEPLYWQTLWEHIKEFREYRKRVYQEFKKEREDGHGRKKWDGKAVVVLIQRYHPLITLNNYRIEVFKFDVTATYRTLDSYQREEQKEGAQKESPRGKLTINPRYFENDENDKKSALAHELVHRARHVQYPAFVHVKEMGMYGNENDGKNPYILQAFEEADVTRIQRAIERSVLGGECKIVPMCYLKLEAALEAYLIRQGVKDPKTQHEKANEKIAELYRDPEKVIRDLPHLFDI